MQVEWFGQSAFALRAGATTVAIDPFGAMPGLAGRGMRFDYPPIAGLAADLLLVTHEHRDHNAVDRVGGDPVVVRSTAGRFDTPVGEVVAVASEHDAVAGTARGPNTLFAFGLGGVRVAHLGDLGQAVLRDEQAADAFLTLFSRVVALERPSFALADLPEGDEPLVVMPAAP